MKGKTPLLLFLALFLNSIPQAIAEPFIHDEDSGIHSRMSDFSRSVSEAGHRMRADYDSMTLNEAQRQLRNRLSAQNDTERAAQDAYSNTQMHALRSGGSNNGYSNNSAQGLFGLPFGSVPGGFFSPGFQPSSDLLPGFASPLEFKPGSADEKHLENSTF